VSWIIGTAANAIVAAAYLTLAWVIFRPLMNERSFRGHRLAIATVAVFFTAALDHVFQLATALPPLFYIRGTSGVRVMAVGWEVVVAVVAVSYVLLRRAYRGNMRGATLYDAPRERKLQAFEINDNIVQGLTVAQLALALNEQERAREAIDSTLVAARKIVTDLLGEAGTDQRLGPGDLRRSAPATLPKK
jgi:signal transduction histidine kinase